MLTWTKWWAPAGTRKWQTRFNSAFEELKKLDFFDRFERNAQILNLMKICPVGIQLFHAERQKEGWDRYIETNSLFWQFYGRT